MGGAPIAVKYMIIAKFEVDGVVEKPDIIGAIFGQTEGLLGDELELRELQKTGKVGRIEVSLKIKNGKTVGEIRIPTSLDKPETALIAAAVETIDKVGPSAARVWVEKLVDVREEKRRKILERAKELLSKWKEEEEIESKKLIEEVVASLRTEKITTYGPEKLPAGPDAEKADELIIVEGRADVLNLLKHGYTNVVAIGGASTVPDSLAKLTKKKKVVIAFLDGDRGGDIVLKTLLTKAKVDYVARAPPGREVEELTGKEIARALNSKVPVEKVVQKPQVRPTVEVKPLRLAPERQAKQLIVVPEKIPEQIVEAVKTLTGSMESIIFDKDWKEIGRYPVGRVYEELGKVEGEVKAVVMDGVVTQRIMEVAYKKGAEWLVGYRISSNISRRPANLKLLSFEKVLETTVEK